MRFYFAQVQDWTSTLVNSGVSGIMLLWFMFRNETRMASLERSFDIMARSNLLRVVADKEVNDVLKEQAQALLDQLNAKEEKRK